MPSPFPGMDPYVEEADWVPFHTLFATEIVRQLSPRLPARYLIYPDKRFTLDVVDESADLPSAPEPVSGRPDVSVVDFMPGRSGEGDGGGTVTVAPLRLVTVVPEPIPQVGIEIRDAADRRLVTAIEVLSPSNKRAPGRDQYLAKRGRILTSSTHLMEIDLLRQGQRVPMRDALPPTAYFVLLSRAESRPVTEVWPISLADRLPEVPVPLGAGDADIMLDLQPAFAEVFGLMRYDVTVDYSRPPRVPLTPQWQTWAADRIRAWQSTRAGGAT